MKLPLISTFAILLLVGSCTDNDESERNAQAYLNSALDVMQENSIYKDTIDWVDFRAKVFETVPHAESIRDTYPAIIKALELLRDYDSRFKPDINGSMTVLAPFCDATQISAPTLPLGVGYIRVAEFFGSKTIAQEVQFAQQIQDQIRAQDREQLEGWIVDLRGNRGGNLWPMLAGVGPLLGDGTTGYFIYPDGKEMSWTYENGASILNSAIMRRVENPYKVIKPNQRVAVLIDGAVASSGEAIAISFIGRDNTRTFGTPTCGRATWNEPSFTLRDGATLVLTTSFMADRNKNILGVAGVQPDVESSSDTVIQDAIEWIQN